MAYSTVTLTGTYQRTDGTPAAGTVEIIPSERLIVDDDGNVILSGRIKVTLDETGSFSADLPATDDDRLNPTGFGYTVSAKLRHTHLPAVSFELPASPATVDITDVTTVDPSTFTPGATYATTASVADVAADVATLEGEVAAVEGEVSGRLSEAALTATIATRVGDVLLDLSTTDAAANTATINAAIADANAAYLAGAGIARIRLPEGEFPIRRVATPGLSYSINVLSGVELYGTGEGKTILTVEPFDLDHVFTESGYETTGYYQSIFYIKGASGDLRKDIYLHDFTVDGNLSNMTGAGTGNANTGDTFDVTFCDVSVVLERLTVHDSSSDAFDVDDSTGVVIRFCTATGARGWGFHNSERSDSLVQIGNYARDCGHMGTRGGFDQHIGTTNGVYVGCVAVGNYQNFGLTVGGTGAIMVGCHSSGGTIADVVLGADFSVHPGKKGEVTLLGSDAKIKMADMASTSQGKHWNMQVSSGVYGLWSNFFGGWAFTVDEFGNARIGGATSRAGASKAVLIPNGTPPPSTPSGGGILYVEGGALKYKGSGGTVTTIAPA